MQTREQVRAKTAYEQVAGLAGQKHAKAYGQLAHKLPVLVRQAGLAQALAFVHARGKEPGQVLLGHLGAYLKSVGLLPEGTANALYERSRNAELMAYVQLTREVEAALLWYKRYAQSVLDVEAGEEVVN